MQDYVIKKMGDSVNKKVCVVGAGRWGKNHIKTLHSLNCLGGIVEADLNTQNDCQEKYPDTRCSRFFNL